MSTYETDGGMSWAPTWTQAMADFRGEDDEPPFDDVTVRMTVPASLGGDAVRVELSNRFGDEPVHVARGAIGVGGRFVEIAFNGQRPVEIPAGESRWTDPVELSVRHSDEIVVDLYLPDPTPYATANGFRYDRSEPGDFAGSGEFPLEGSALAEVDTSREFPAVNTGAKAEPDGTGWSLPAGGPFLRTIEVAGDAAAVVVCVGSSSTVMGWPQYAAALLPADARIAILNRGIAGNRIRLDAPQPTPSWGRSGLSRFDEDVLRTHGVSDVVIGYTSNDWGLPGRVTPSDEMPTVGQMIDAYQELIDRAQAAGLGVILATVTPLQPELAVDPDLEAIRLALNDWIRSSGHPFADFDAVIRSEDEPPRIRAEYAAPDGDHPNVNGEKCLAQTLVDTISGLGLPHRR